MALLGISLGRVVPLSHCLRKSSAAFYHRQATFCCAKLFSSNSPHDHVDQRLQINNIRLLTQSAPFPTQNLAHHTLSKVLPLGARHFATEASIVAKVRGIQKDISPLTTRKVVRKKRTKNSSPKDQVVFDVVAYATAEELDLEALEASFLEKGLYGVCKLPNDTPDALQFQANYRVGDEPREIFFFREGCVVFWNMPEVERVEVLRSIHKHQSDSYDNLLVMDEYEHVEFTYTDSDTNLVGNELHLQAPDQKEAVSEHQLEKYAFSNALSLSVKLSVWEASLAKYVDSIEYVLQDLTEGKPIKISRAEVLQKTGELFTLKHLINLSSDLLDTPDFYWDREGLEGLYSKTCNYLSITRRTRVMNEKLHHCCELMELLSSHLNDKHHVRLEWMIIILIMVEVLFEVVRMLGKLH